MQKGNMKIVLEDYLNGIQKTFESNEIPIDEKYFRLKLVCEAIDLIIDRSPNGSDEDKKRAKIANYVLMGNFAFSHMKPAHLSQGVNYEN